MIRILYCIVSYSVIYYLYKIYIKYFFIIYIFVCCILNSKILNPKFSIGGSKRIRILISSDCVVLGHYGFVQHKLGLIDQVNIRSLY